MSERKVLTKYYPPDFDPSKLTRTPKHLRPSGPKLMTVRLMAPFSMRCLHCGEYIYKGRKFNARKETTDEKYLSIAIYRFYIRCTRCSGEITFKTNPATMDYDCEKGAKRNFEPWRDAGAKAETEEERLDRLEREEGEAAEQEERDKMAELEEKMLESKREMAVADALDEIRMRNARIERGEKAGAAAEAIVQDAEREKRDAQARQDAEDAEIARRAFQAKAAANEVIQEEPEAPSTASTISTPSLVASKISEPSDSKASMPPPSFARVKKPKKALPGSLGIKKKTPLV